MWSESCNHSNLLTLKHRSQINYLKNKWQFYEFGFLLLTTLKFQHEINNIYIYIYFLPSKAIETALDCLKSANTEPYYRRQAWEVIKCFLVAMTSLDDNKHALYQLLSHPK